MLVDVPKEMENLQLLVDTEIENIKSSAANGQYTKEDARKILMSLHAKLAKAYDTCTLNITGLPKSARPLPEIYYELQPGKNGRLVHPESSKNIPRKKLSVTDTMIQLIAVAFTGVQSSYYEDYTSELAQGTLQLIWKILDDVRKDYS